MKKFVLAFAASVFMLTATPAFACRSANCMNNMQEWSPVYQAASHPYYNYGYAPVYGYSPYVAPAYGQDTTCILDLFCSSHPERPQVGQTCSDASGKIFAMDANKRWYYVEGSNGASMNVGQVVSKCPFSTYEATAASPAPVVMAAPAPAAPAPVVPGSFTYQDGNCLYTVTTLADGTHKVTKRIVSK